MFEPPFAPQDITESWGQPGADAARVVEAEPHVMQYGPVGTYFQIIDVCTHKFNQTSELLVRYFLYRTYWLFFPLKLF